MAQKAYEELLKLRSDLKIIKEQGDNQHTADQKVYIDERLIELDKSSQLQQFIALHHGK